VDVLTGGGEYAPSTEYTLITAAGALTGQFDNVVTDFEFLDPSLSYDDHHVYLTMTRNNTQFTSVAQTANQTASASYLESVSADKGVHSLIVSLLNLNVANARNAFSNIAGDGLATYGRISQMQSGRFMDALSSRMGGGIPGGGSFGIARDLDIQEMPLRDSTFFQSVANTRGMWMRSFGLQGSMSSDGNSMGSKWRGSGSALGFDAPIGDNVLVGTAFLYGRDGVQLNEGAGGSARIKLPQLVTYGSYSFAGDALRGWQVRGMVSYGQPTISSERWVAVGPETSIATSQHTGREWSAEGAAEFSRNLYDFRVQGMFGLRASRLVEEGYTETGSVAALDISGRSTQSLTSQVGARLLIPTYHKEGLVDLHATWNRELANLQSQLTGRLASATSDARFTVDGVPMARNGFTLGAGLSGKLKRNLSMYGDYSIELRGSGQREQTALAGLRLVW